MNKRNLFKAAVSMLLILIMSVGVIFVSTPETYAASSGKLVKTVKQYYKSGKKWKLSRKTTYKYNSKKDPIKITETYKIGKKTHKTIYTIKYTYKSGKKVTAKKYVKYDSDKKVLDSKTTYDSKGRPSVIDYYDQDDPSISISSEKLVYGKNGYVTKIKSGFGDDTVIKYKWRGSKAKSLKSNMVIDGEKYKKALTVFNKKGFVQKPTVYTQADPVMIYTYKYNKGLVKTANVEMQEGYDRYYERYTLTYTKKSISQKRYRAMINAAVCGDYPDTIGTTWY